MSVSAEPGESDWLEGTSYPLRCKDVRAGTEHIFVKCCKTDYCNDVLNVSLATTTTEGLKRMLLNMLHMALSLACIPNIYRVNNEVFFYRFLEYKLR